MDSTGSKKKKTNGHVRQSSEITIDLETTTPPWVPPLHQHQESALRSTQPQPAERTVNPREFHFKATVPKDDRTRASRVATRPSAPPTSAATTLPKIDGNRCKKSVVKVATKPPVTQTLCRESARTSPEQFSNKTAAIQQPTPAHDTVYVDQQGRRHVDTDNGNDEVYFKNAHGNSWTGPLIDDEEAHVRDTTKTSLPEQAQRALAEIQTISSPQRGGIWASKHAPTAGKEKEKWRKDMHLQQIIRQVKQIIRSRLREFVELASVFANRLTEGAKLTLQHHGNNAKTERAETVTCSHPYCPSSDRLVSDGDYYIVIDSTPSESIFCLRCLEGLWNGKDMASSLPDPKVCSAWSARPESMPESHLLDLDGIAEHDADEIDYPEIPYVGDSSHDGAELMEAFDLSCSASDGSSKDASASPWSPVTLTASTPATDVFSVREQLFPVPAERTMLTKRLIASSMGVQASTPAAVPLDEDSDRDEVISPSVSKASRQSSKRGPEGTNNADHGLTLATILRRSNRRQPVAFQEPEGGTGTEIVPSAGKKERVAKTITTDALVEDITRAEKQLKKRYLRRESVLAEMTPGSSSPVHQRTYGGKVAKSMAIRMDDFGIVCTDLLSEPVSYLSQEAQPVRVNPSRKLYRLIATLQGKWLMQQEMEVDADYRQHWCICHGVDDGRIMVLCGNRFCLYGWFHLECLGITDVPTENGMLYVDFPVMLELTCTLQKNGFVRPARLSSHQGCAIRLFKLRLHSAQTNCSHSHGRPHIRPAILTVWLQPILTASIAGL